MPDVLTLLAAYLACDAAAADTVLSRDQVARCGDIYLALKLAFLPDIGVPEYSALSADERAEVGRTAYLRFADWRAAHPDMLNSARALAGLAR